MKLAIGLVFAIVACGAFAASRTTCEGQTNAVYGLVKVDGQFAANPLDSNYDYMHTVQKHAVTLVNNLSTANCQGYCRCTEANQSDSNYDCDGSTNCTAMETLVMATSPSMRKEARIPANFSFIVPVRGDVPNPGTHYKLVQQIGSTTCKDNENDQNYYYKVCLCEKADCT